MVCRGVPHDSLAYALYYVALIELPHFLMERRMLLGIKERAERGRLASSSSGVKDSTGLTVPSLF